MGLVREALLAELGRDDPDPSPPVVNRKLARLCVEPDVTSVATAERARARRGDVLTDNAFVLVELYVCFEDAFLEHCTALRAHGCGGGERRASRRMRRAGRCGV
mgnify:FL=1